MENLTARYPPIEKLVSFFHLCEKAKYTSRTSVTSTGMPDNVASHSWRMTIIALAVHPHLRENISLEKVLKMIIIHDLAEIEVGDINLIKLLEDPELAKCQALREKEFFEALPSHLPFPSGSEFLELWSEFQENSSHEARLVHAIDKIEAQLQNNESGSTEFRKELQRLGKTAQIYSLFTFDEFVQNLFYFCLDSDKLGGQKIDKQGD